jgi:hypothetical protein
MIEPRMRFKLFHTAISLIGYETMHTLCQNSVELKRQESIKGIKKNLLLDCVC